MLQKAKALGAQAFIPTSYEGDLISMTRQMKQMNINFPYVFMVYASTPQFQAIGPDADYIFSHTNYHPSINWKVTAGYDREQFQKAYDRLFPKAEFAQIAEMKKRAMALGVEVKKSELIRAGLQLIAGLQDTAFKKALAAVQ